MPITLQSMAAVTRQDEVLAEIRRVILEGGVPPGSSISPEAVARHLEISAIPVREALKTLVGEGLVEHRPHAPYTVARLLPAELNELYVIRGVLETAAIRAAVAQADLDDDARVGEALSALGASIIGQDHKAYHRESRSFHLALVQPSQMMRLVNLLNATWNLTEPYQPMARVGPDEQQALHEEHTLMFAAFKARDADELVRVATLHDAHLQRIIALVLGEPT